MNVHLSGCSKFKKVIMIENIKASLKEAQDALDNLLLNERVLSQIGSASKILIET